MVAVILSSMVRSLASLICRPPAAARTFAAHLGFMKRYLVITLCIGAMFSVLVLAGLGAAGSWRGAWRYVRMWFFQVGILVAVAMVVSLIAYGLTPPAT